MDEKPKLWQRNVTVTRNGQSIIPAASLNDDAYDPLKIDLSSDRAEALRELRSATDVLGDNFVLGQRIACALHFWPDKRDPEYRLTHADPLTQAEIEALQENAPGGGPCKTRGVRAVLAKAVKCKAARVSEMIEILVNEPERFLRILHGQETWTPKKQEMPSPLVSACKKVLSLIHSEHLTPAEINLLANTAVEINDCIAEPTKPQSTTPASPDDIPECHEKNMESRHKRWSSNLLDRLRGGRKEK